MITFSNGRSALYSAELLYASLPQAQKLPEEDDDESRS